MGVTHEVNSDVEEEMDLTKEPWNIQKKFGKQKNHEYNLRSCDRVAKGLLKWYNSFDCVLLYRLSLGKDKPKL